MKTSPAETPTPARGIRDRARTTDGLEFERLQGITRPLGRIPPREQLGEHEAELTDIALRGDIRLVSRVRD